jgi:phage terminase large subunit
MQDEDKLLKGVTFAGQHFHPSDLESLMLKIENGYLGGRDLEVAKYIISTAHAMQKYSLNPKQTEFVKAKEDYLLYGGAAGGGKTYVQAADADMKAHEYPGIRQLILRRTFPELQMSVINLTFELYSQEDARYKAGDKVWIYFNGSKTYFGYLESDADVMRYQSAEFDIIRFDEATHFSPYQLDYMFSRVRGVNNFPKQIKMTTNPGGSGHSHIKGMFIDNKEPHKTYEDQYKLSYKFIPARVQDNTHLMENDPRYLTRLYKLPEKERRMLLEGDWDVFEGQYFPEFSRETHVVDPFIIPTDWRRYAAMDYGLDMFAVIFVAVSPQNKHYIYREIHEKNLIISEASTKLLEVIGDQKIKSIYAPPDLWNRRQDTGRSAAEIFLSCGVRLVKSINDRILGWYNVKELLKPYDTRHEQTGKLCIESKLKIFSTCVNLIRCIPAAIHDDRNPNDVAAEPHDITHINDALRYYCSTYSKPARRTEEDIQGVYHIQELYDRGFKKHEINSLVRRGLVRLIGKAK